MTKNTDWIIQNIGRGCRLECLRCGRFYDLTFPIEVWAMDALSWAFTKEHRGCRLKPEGLHCIMCGEIGHRPADCVRLKPTSVDEWLSGPDTGTSSRTIVHAIHGRGLVGFSGPSTPRDPDDFGRCYRLLMAIPALRAKLPVVAEKYPEWAPLVREWNRMTALYEKELPSGKAPELYALMKELAKESGVP